MSYSEPSTAQSTSLTSGIDNSGIGDFWSRLGRLSDALTDSLRAYYDRHDQPDCKQPMPASCVMRARLAALLPGAAKLTCGICHLSSDNVPLSDAWKPYGFTER